MVHLPFAAVHPWEPTSNDGIVEAVDPDGDPSSSLRPDPVDAVIGRIDGTIWTWAVWDIG